MSAIFAAVRRFRGHEPLGLAFRADFPRQLPARAFPFLAACHRALSGLDPAIYLSGEPSER